MHPQLHWQPAAEAGTSPARTLYCVLCSLTEPSSACTDQQQPAHATLLQQQLGVQSQSSHAPGMPITTMWYACFYCCAAAAVPAADGVGINPSQTAGEQLKLQPPTAVPEVQHSRGLCTANKLGAAVIRSRSCCMHATQRTNVAAGQLAWKTGSWPLPDSCCLLGTRFLIAHCMQLQAESTATLLTDSVY
jgi:hypothetical protein